MLKKLIVMSADAMVAEDLEELKKQPNYQKYLAGGCEVTHVRSIYPTVTYPCHATMSTGVYPDKHGVCSNFEFRPGVSPLPWCWDRKFNRCPDDIFFAAHRAGYKTAGVFWPVTGNHPAIDCLIDECWPVGAGDDSISAFRRMGSDEAMLSIVRRHVNDEQLRVRRHPDIDFFSVACACDVIREHKPDVLFLHPANIDSSRHHFGLFNDQVKNAVQMTDRWIGELMQAAQDAGMTDMNFVLTSDHGQMEIKRVVHLNALLAENGLIRLNADGAIKDYDAYCQSTGMSTQVFLKDGNDAAAREKTLALLERLLAEGVYGFSRILTKEEAEKEEHLKGDFEFVLETDGYTSFGDKVLRPLVTSFDSDDYRYGHATHGYLPQKGPQPIFLAKGPDFMENVTLNQGRLIDEAPTYAKLLGVSLPLADGRPMDDLIRS